MFTGIIEQLGTVLLIQEGTNEIKLAIKAELKDVTLGESIAINGVCLTVTAIEKKDIFHFYVSPETMDRTSLGSLKVGSRVNLERALKADMRLSGHIVQGHVDGTAVLDRIDEKSESYRFTFCLDHELARYTVLKGSISIDGISLTISHLEEHGSGTVYLSVDIIPHTWEKTNLQTKKPGDLVNIEVDILAKYMEKLCHPHLTMLKEH